MVSDACLWLGPTWFSLALTIFYSPVEKQNDLELDFKVFSSLILVVESLYVMNLASLSVLKYSR